MIQFGVRCWMPLHLIVTQQTVPSVPGLLAVERLNTFGMRPRAVGTHIHSRASTLLALLPAASLSVSLLFKAANSRHSLPQL